MADSDEEEEIWDDAQSYESDEEWTDVEELHAIRDLVTYVAEVAKASEAEVNRLNATDPESLRMVFQILQDNGVLFPTADRARQIVGVHPILQSAVKETLLSHAQKRFRELCEVLEEERWRMRDMHIFHLMSLELNISRRKLAHQIIESGWYVPRTNLTFEWHPTERTAVRIVELKRAVGLVPDKDGRLCTVNRAEGVYMHCDTREIYVDFPRTVCHTLRTLSDQWTVIDRLFDRLLRTEPVPQGWPSRIRLLPYLLQLYDDCCLFRGSTKVINACESEIMTLVDPPTLATLMPGKVFTLDEEKALRVKFMDYASNPFIVPRSPQEFVIDLITLLFPVYSQKRMNHGQPIATWSNTSIFRPLLFAIDDMASVMCLEFSWNWPPSVPLRLAWARVGSFAAANSYLFFKTTELFHSYGMDVNTLRVRDGDPVFDACLWPQARFLEKQLNEVNEQPHDFTLALLSYYGGGRVTPSPKRTLANHLGLHSDSAAVTSCPSTILAYLLQHHVFLIRSLAHKCDRANRGHFLQCVITSALVRADEIHKPGDIRRMLRHAIPMLLKTLPDVLAFIDNVKQFAYVPFADEIFRAISPVLWQQVPEDTRARVTAVIDPRLRYGTRKKTFQ